MKMVASRPSRLFHSKNGIWQVALHWNWSNWELILKIRYLVQMWDGKMYLVYFCTRKRIEVHSRVQWRILYPISLAIPLAVGQRLNMLSSSSTFPNDFYQLQPTNSRRLPEGNASASDPLQEKLWPNLCGVAPLLMLYWMKKIIFEIRF